MEGKNQFLLKAITKNKAVQYYPNFALFLLNFVFRKCGYRIPQMWVFLFRKRGSYLFFHKFSTDFSTININCQNNIKLVRKYKLHFTILRTICRVLFNQILSITETRN